MKGYMHKQTNGTQAIMGMNNLFCSTSMFYFSSSVGTILYQILITMLPFHLQIYLLQTSLPLERRPSWLPALSLAESAVNPSLATDWMEIIPRSFILGTWKCLNPTTYSTNICGWNRVLPDWTGINSRIWSLSYSFAFDILLGFI